VRTSGKQTIPVNGCSSKGLEEILIIGTSLNDSLLSLVTALKFDGVNPVPDMTKREKSLEANN
jgi:hypothetical protein